MATPTRVTITGRQAAAGAVAAAALVIAGFVGHSILQPAKPVPPQCALKAGASAATIQTAVNVCTTVSLAAGTYALTAHIVLSRGVTISGAGPTLTFLVQHAAVNIFQVTAPGVTIENMNVNTATFNPGVPPVQKSPVPGTIFSAQNNTHILNLDSESGTGFGFRLTGPNPCQDHKVSGDEIENVSSTNTGGGGFTAMDFDCMSNGLIENVVIHGDYIALYESSGVTVNGEVSTPGPFNGKCTAPVFVSGPADNDTLENITSNGGKVIAKGSVRGPVTNLVQKNIVVLGKGC
jgi:hypothetical protein